MQKRFQRLTGYCLIIGSILMVLTMLLHPAGGNIEHIIRISKMVILSHSIAVLSIPFIAFGFYGLAKKLNTESGLSYLGLSIIGFALVAVMLAALLNGLVLPMYLIKNATGTGQKLDSINQIISYSTTFNSALDYVFIAGYSLSMLIWSLLIIRTVAFPKWHGILGLVLVGISLTGVILQLNFISVTGFTVYVFGIVSWIISAGWLLITIKLPNGIQP
jgi:hypothetical protein